ncbi:MAG: cob(I)yrinic acid a,c-diamide adenosyltransferase [Rhodospirillaceae bacterium]|nr:cob(I)yrinic acid a,c-diamide adenosyltransferase [Rhodospirillaceae bacterium]
MVNLTKIYTRGGDKGETSLGNGERVKKHSLRISANGAVDAANAAIGVVRLHTGTLQDQGKADNILARIQNEMFDLGADLTTPLKPGEAAGTALRIVASQVKNLENDIDALNAGLKPLTSFVLPAGTSAAAQLHVARTSTREAERAITALADIEPVNPEAVAYINRLSDLLFVMARYANTFGPGDVLWVPGQSR